MWLTHCYLEALRSQCVEIHCEQLECVSHDLVREHIQVNVDKVRHLNTCNDKQEDASISKLHNIIMSTASNNVHISIYSVKFLTLHLEAPSFTVFSQKTI